MIIYQDAPCNMCEAEKIYANDKISVRRIEEDNEKKRLEGNSLGGKGGTKVGVQMDADLNMLEKSRDRSTNTREQGAKMSGVGTGTIARYDAVMKSGDEKLKK